MPFQLRSIEAKKRRLDFIRETTDYFPTLNDDCIFEVLEYLSTSDLCAISKSCKRLQHLAGVHFQRKNPEKTVCIKQYGSGKFHLTPHEEYVAIFSRYLLNVSIQVSPFSMGEDLADFMISAVNEKTKKLVFSSGTSQITSSFADDIKSILENVERIEFSMSFPNAIQFNDVLKHCKRIQQLVINPDAILSTTYKLPTVQLKTIEYFQCDLFESAMVQNLDIFLKLNSTLKRFACTIGKQNCPSNVDVASCLNPVVTDATNLKELYLQFCLVQVDWASVRNEIDVLSSCRHLDQVKMKFCGTDIAGLPSIESLTHLHLDRVKNAPNFISNLKLFDHLKILIFECVPLHKDFAENLSKNIRSLEELTIWEDKAIIPWDCADLIKPFARHSPNLKKINLRVYIFTDNGNQVIKLNKIRVRLNDACLLNITLPGQNIPELTDAVNTLNKGDGLVKITTIGWQEFTMSDFFPV